MNPANACCVILLAAGNSSRYGAPKLLQPFDGLPLVRRAALSALHAGAEVRVVTGAYAPQIAQALDGIGVRLVHNAAWAEGMGTSIGTAFRGLIDEGRDVEAAVVCPADLPLIGSEQLQRLFDAHRAQPGRAVISVWDHSQGPPCLFPRDWFEALSALRGPQGARRLLAARAGELVRVEMPEAAADIDTPQDHARIEQARR